MKKTTFPLEKTKVSGLTKKFDLTTILGRKAYFEAKAGAEIKKIRKFLKTKSFIAILLGKKNAGKGTYAKIFTEIFGESRVASVSIGDAVRETHLMLKGKGGRAKVKKYLEENYRGYLSPEEALEAILGRSTSKLLPTELTLSLLILEITKHPRQALFIDGFPRRPDQIPYTLYLKELVGREDNPDFFILINVPLGVIDERLKYRVICPKCHTPKNLRQYITEEVGYDKKKKEFYLRCDNPACGGVRMVAKEGDELGIKAIKERLKTDEELIQKIASLHGVPKVLLRNSVPVSKAKKLVDDYEVTPEYTLRYDRKTDEVRVEEKPWVVKDDEGVESYSLLPAPVALSMIRQITAILDQSKK